MENIPVSNINIPVSNINIPVSIITITQFIRFESLKILFEMIKKQTYQNILEWVIVEGSNNLDDANKNKILINNFIKTIKLNVNYIEYTGKKLGSLRNLGNQSCLGDIIVCLDDDDYYPPTRIEEAVNKLSNSSCLLGGVSDVYLYDFIVDKLFKFKGFMEYHSTNNCMAFKKELLYTHKHDPEIHVGEERSFTNEFTTPLVKFDSKNTIIAISHNTNTFNKRELCLGGVLKTLNTLTEIEEPITNYIDIDIYNMMKKIYYTNKNNKYDIVYLLGYLSRKFHPNDNNLDTSEHTIIKLCENFSSKGLKVAIYGEFNLEKKYKINNVVYIHWKKFPYNEKFKTLILGKTFGIFNASPFNINADKIYWDSYENPFGNQLLINLLNKNKIDKYFFKSNFHYSQVKEHIKEINNYEIIPLGIRENFLINKYNISRQKYRFIYDAYYDRGLEFIITGIFSIIKKIEPRAELHVYGGMEGINDENFINKMIMLFSEHGVTDHGRQPLDSIIRSKYLSEFHIYISNILNEIDCQSIKESIVCGCIPLTVNFGVFTETEGIKYSMNHNDPKVMQKCALEILQLAKDNNKLEQIRNTFKNSNTIQPLNVYCDTLYKKI
jgi:glycosyltransferase involved in cell wall biosynthesis